MTRYSLATYLPVFMAFIAEWETSPPFLREALNAEPAMILKSENASLTPDDGMVFLFWASEGDFEAFERALDADPTVRSFTVLTTFRDRRLYQTIREGVLEEYGLTALLEHDIQFMESTLSHTGAIVRVRCPSRASLAALKYDIEALYGSFVLRNVFVETESGLVSTPLTVKQHEAICLALERGYFEVPRSASLSELARELDISNTAASQRIRRGNRTLVEDACRPYMTL